VIRQLRPSLSIRLSKELKATSSPIARCASSKFRQPSQEAADRAFAQVTSKFASPQDLQAQLSRLGLTESDARRMVTEELYLSSFLDFKFRPAAQVTPDEMQSYYQDTLVPELKSRGEPPPPFASVEEQVREVLTQKAIDQRTQQWLEETRARLQIERVSPGNQP
jgi:predicted transcriptional regulator